MHNGKMRAANEPYALKMNIIVILKLRDSILELKKSFESSFELSFYKFCDVGK